MPDETIIGTDVKSALDNLEHYTLRNHLARTHDYNRIKSALEKDENISLEDIDRLLTICVHDLSHDRMFTVTILNILPVIVCKIQLGKYDPPPNLLPSILAVVHVMKTASLLSRVDSLKQMCFETMLSYPNDTLIQAAEQDEEIMEIFNLHCHARVPADIRKQACGLLHRLLKILPPEKKTKFVEKGISVWFSKIIPTVMSILWDSQDTQEMLVELLELLTDELVAFDYTENLQWNYLLACICDTQKYPAIMKNLLAKGATVWHRIWIIFIRLLKHQITQSQGAIGTPINSMLPIVESAFKVDVDNRCKAFECWNVLIDSFATETNENNISKRLKLLIIPLRSNNAKAEASALAKFKCWWHLIQKFQNKVDKFMDSILVTFLHFCFGKHSVIDRSVLIPGQISMAVKKQCIQALVDIVGHVNCDGCTDLPKLSGKLINTKNLVEHWNHWIFSLTSAIMLSAVTDNGLTKQQMTCLWKSYMMTIGELPENTIRKDLYTELLAILSRLVKECNSNSNLTDIVFNALIMSVFDEDIRIKQLLQTGNDANCPLLKIMTIILDPALHLAYESCSFTEMVAKLRPITDKLFDPLYCSPAVALGHVLQTFTATDVSLTVWTSIAESICESRYGIPCVQRLGDIMMWPLKSINVFTHIKVSAMAWYTLYDTFHPKLKRSETFDKAISEFLCCATDFTHSTVYFKLCVILSVLKHKLAKEGCKACEKDLELLHIVSSRIDNYDSYEQIFPILIDRVLNVISIIVSDINESAARNIFFCAKKMLKVMTLTCKQLTDASHILSFIESLLMSLESLIQVELYQRFIPIIVDDLIDCSIFLSQQSATKSIVLSVMKTLTAKVAETTSNFKKIKTIINGIENKTTVPDKNKFTTPKAKDVPKKMKKKEPSIVNTVVENGEEYVVVKSNWKFNPRKLTENQKEKLQRKREDIPALYQDLSQSQDEFKLVSWKTDSQDTSNSSRSESKSSKPVGTETTTEILSNLPSSNVVPKILETFFAENVKKDSPTIAKDVLPPANNANKIEPVTPKNTKSPRMALKDRVFRNVRNLMENSGLQKENKDASADLNKTESIIRTPTQIKSDATVNIVNTAQSAPPLLPADRPSRVKRKPKKFDELQLLNIKRSRQSVQNLKTKSLSKQSKPDPAPLNIDTKKDANLIIEASLPVDFVPNKEDLNKPSDLQGSEKRDTSGTNEFLQSKEDLQKDTSDTVDKKVLLNEIEIEMDFKNNITSMDLDTSIGMAQNNEISVEKTIKGCNNQNAETCIDINDNNSSKGSDNSPTSNVIQVQSPDKNKDTSPIEKVGKMSVNEKNEVPKDKKSADKTSPSPKEVPEISTPQQASKNKGSEEQKSTTKKRKSRIEKELAIDMVEGHPYLKMQTQKRLTRKALESAGSDRRKSLVEKLNKSKSEANSAVKTDKRSRDKNRESDSSSSNSSLTVEDSQEKHTEIKDTSFTEDLPFSEDVIESSQDSTITTISVKSTKKTSMKVPVVSLEKIKLLTDKPESINESQSILDSVIAEVSESAKANQESKDDIELPLNKTAPDEQCPADLTENMDTEPMENTDFSEVVIVVNDEPAPLTISSDENPVGQETQEIAEADTQPTDPKDFMEVDIDQNTDTMLLVVDITSSETCSGKNKESPIKDKSITEKPVSQTEDITVALSDSAIVEIEKESGASSPSSFGDEAKRKQDFLNNTLEISPIKNMSPERNKKSPSPDTSGDYVVITLSSPVNSNGEPLEKCGSPEVFTEDKVSPDKRDQSPPRVEVTVTNTSPSSSLSLKKNRPQVRSGGRGAQMLGLCCDADKVQAIINQDKAETEETKKAGTSSTPARRNLRILYNSVSENIEPPSENEDSETFLKFRRSLPAVDCSPSGPILKRKLVEIVDDATVSPASKRKRVSFHDPPVSTTVSVQKYIEPGGIRSPQNSAQKRLERQNMRQNTPLKSPKRLDHAFKLDTVLNRAVESFTETSVISSPEDTQQFSLDETPVVEIVRASELNDTDPICPELIDCKDPIDVIALDLSCKAMKLLLVKELAGTVDTVGDLAKMTELEVNRLCIKAPKVKIARKVLSDYASKRVTHLDKPPCDVMVKIDEAIFDEPMPESEVMRVDSEAQTVASETVEMEVQTAATPTTVTFVQTDTTPTVHTFVQTDESGKKTTADIVKTSLAERPDFVEQVGEHLEESSIQQITDKLPFSAIADVLMKKITPTDAKLLLNRVLEDQWNKTSNKKSSSKELSFIREYMCDRFDPKDLILFCSEVLKSVYDKPAFT